MAEPDRGEPQSGLVPSNDAVRLWTSSDGEIAIEFSVALIEEIRTEIVRALHGIGRGGVEVGGLLLGTVDGGDYFIDAWRPIRCDHSRGASFLLSDRDIATLSCQIEAVQVDPALEGRQVAGWFVSHTRGGLDPRIEESELHTTHFATTGSILLTVQPSRYGDAEAAVHLFEPGDPPSLLPLDPPLSILPAPGVRSASGESRQLLEQPAPWPNQPAPPSRKVSFVRRWLPWLVAAAAAAFFILGILAVRGQKQTAQAKIGESGPVHIEPTGPPRPLLSLHLEKAEDSIQISWDATSPAISSAKSGTLTVVDQGETFTRALTGDELRLGRIDYTRSQGEIRIRLTVDTDAGQLAEDAHYEPFHLPGHSR